MIFAPVSDDRDEGPAASDQLALAIDADGPSTAKVPPRTREASFADRVLRVVSRIPPGRVATYGDIARACGNPSGSRAVGTILAGHSFEVPTHRVVDARGFPSSAFGGGPGVQLERLAAEGVGVEGGRVDLSVSRWPPE